MCAGDVTWPKVNTDCVLADGWGCVERNTFYRNLIGRDALSRQTLTLSPLFLTRPSTFVVVHSLRFRHRCDARFTTRDYLAEESRLPAYVPRQLTCKVTPHLSCTRMLRDYCCRETSHGPWPWIERTAALSGRRLSLYAMPLAS